MKKLLFLACFVAFAAQAALFPPKPTFPKPNQIIVSGPTKGTRIYNGNVGLTNAFWNLTNSDTMLIGPGTYTVKAYKNTSGYGAGGLQCGRQTATVPIHDILIEGYSAIIATTNYGTIMSFFGPSNIAIRGLSFVGDLVNVTNYTNGVDFTPEGAVFFQTNYSGGPMENLWINQCSFYAMPDQAISFMWPGAFESRVTDCYFDTIGRTNNINGYTADGACISGIQYGGIITGNKATNVVHFFEWDGSIAGVARRSSSIIVQGNRVERLFKYGIFFAAASSGCSVQDVKVLDNFLSYHAAWQEVTPQVSAGIFLGGSVSNCLVRGNTVAGVLNAAGNSMAVLDSAGNNKDVVITDNTFRDSTITGIRIDSTTTKGAERITVSRNQFISVAWPLYIQSQNILISDNTFKGWLTAVPAIYVNAADASNIICRGNILVPTNTGSFALHLEADYPGCTLEDTVVQGTGLTAMIEAGTTVSNLFYRGEGAAAPTVGTKVGSQYRLTTSAHEPFYIQTNSMGGDGWRPVDLN